MRARVRASEMNSGCTSAVCPWMVEPASEHIHPQGITSVTMQSSTPASCSSGYLSQQPMVGTVHWEAKAIYGEVGRPYGSSGPTHRHGT